VTVAQLATAWVLRPSGATAAIAGSGSASHALQSAAASELLLDDGILRAIENLVPLGPALA
jgi:aryl-alcohol dehydrogenase-like predicted oxidoreductase